jgi:hypothetical protein
MISPRSFRDRSDAEQSCLISYFAELVSRAADDIIGSFQGVQPAAGPFETSTRLESIFNLRAARGRDLTRPRSIAASCRRGRRLEASAIMNAQEFIKPVHYRRIAAGLLVAVVDRANHLVSWSGLRGESNLARNLKRTFRGQILVLPKLTDAVQRGDG